MDWFRSHHGAPTDPKWLLIAQKVGAKAGEVAAIFWALLDHASQHVDRGSVAGFDHEAVACFFGFDPDRVAAIHAALCARGLIVEGRIGKWSDRQPKRERDDNSTDRVRAYRERQTPENPSKSAPEDQPKRTETPGNATKRLDKRRVEEIREEEEFVAWYATYPRKQAPKKAEQAYHRARREGATAEELLAGVERYRLGKPTYADWQMPAPWLNGRRWLDEYGEPQNDEHKPDRPTGPPPLLAVVGGREVGMAC